MYSEDKQLWKRFLFENQNNASQHPSRLFMAISFFASLLLDSLQFTPRKETAESQRFGLLQINNKTHCINQPGSTKCAALSPFSIWTRGQRQKAPHGGPIPRLGVIPGVEIWTIEFLLVSHSNYRLRMHRLATVHARDNQPTTNNVTTQPISISASFTKVKWGA